MLNHGSGGYLGASRHGEVRLRSEPGGTCFEVLLPAR
jgi:hypothetical protein